MQVFPQIVRLVSPCTFLCSRSESWPTHSPGPCGCSCAGLHRRSKSTEADKFVESSELDIGSELVENNKPVERNKSGHSTWCGNRSRRMVLKLMKRDEHASLWLRKTCRWEMEKGLGVTVYGRAVVEFYIPFQNNSSWIWCRMPYMGYNGWRSVLVL